MRPLLCLCLLLLSWAAVGRPTALLRLYTLPDAALLVVDSQGREVRAYHPDRPLIPASTLKLLTALMALQTWGPDHRFTTDFLRGADGRLWIRGYGDPWLTSEELDGIVTELKAAGIGRIAGIGVDDGHFAGPLTVDGQTETDNPYDAALGALAVNFNTLHVEKRGGRLSSAEPQTPLTPLARQLARRLPDGRHRINLGHRTDAARYFAEVLREKLRQREIEVTGTIVHTPVPDNARLIVRHRNRHPLDRIVAGMLKYSNNFIANQLFLLLGAERFGPPATLEKGRRAAADFIGARFHWRNWRVLEGAGLSRRNRLSARQLVEVLQRLRPYARLLPQRIPGIRAKTGTLKGVSSYAGYIDGGDKTFALIINQTVPYDLRLRVAEALRD
ncbi:serine-type D-Ala-D-Ala carboxypeptidase/endopeptidase [Methylomarinovum tepidoasis]|uniref:Serine-type D-Ala-D-Ala carboxypeptidase/endopeptidase n=1 Tax=Methylomarinovum tepidoasis TaxID=2840183 RepID=A0AAU9CYB2_9GAMM|nr:D-alanyl-D-alanine carboxypeptidase [Methylomarinovum sp. IN45]BCX89710.1 serine-type D-Ala-D-Ala carboxypeptidase/endopeptidase [Methylomarinovum sp. IN45]